MTELVLYDQFRSALAECVAIDEIAGIKDKAAKLEAYARVRDDADAQRQFAEIRLRACIRIGEISRELEKAKSRHDNGVARKTETLANAGINPRTAERYEELTGGKEEQAQKTASEAADLYFATQREKQEPSTMGGLKNSIKNAVETALGPPPKKPKRSGPPILSAQDTANMHWNAWIMDVDDLEPELAADGEDEEFAQEEINHSERAIDLIRRYQARMKEIFNVTTKA